MIKRKQVVLSLPVFSVFERVVGMFRVFDTSDGNAVSSFYFGIDKNM